MQQQQERRERISKILAGNRDITLEQLLYSYFDQKTPLQEIGKKLLIIEREENDSDDTGYHLKLYGKRVAALNDELVIDVLIKVHEMKDQNDGFNEQDGNQFMGLDQGSIRQTKDELQAEQEQFRQEQPTKSHHQNRNQDQQNLQQPQSFKEDPSHSQNGHLVLQIDQSVIRTAEKQQDQKNIFQPEGQKQQTQIHEDKKPLEGNFPLSPSKNNEDKKQQSKPNGKSIEKKKSLNQKTPNLNKSLSSQKKLKQPPSNQKKIKQDQEKQKKQTLTNEQKPLIKLNTNVQFQVNQFSVLDSKLNVQKQKRLQKRKLLLLQKQKQKQKQRLALLKQQMNSQIHNEDNKFNSLDPPKYPNHNGQKNKQTSALKQQSKHWNSKQQSKQVNPFFNHLQDDSFEQDPEIMPNFQNQEELQQLSDDLKNHKNLFDKRGFQHVSGQRIIQRSQSFYSKQYQTLKNKLNRYLIIAYYQYVLQAHSTDVIFEKDQIFKKPLMDLTYFLKFYKDFDLKEFLKVPDVTKIFKKSAVNHLWLDVQKFIQICHKIIEIKSGQNGKDPTYVNTEQEILERAGKFISFFNKEKIKQFLKIHNKDAWDKILEEYKNRQLKRTVQKPHSNKGEVVGKFLQRNFDLQLPKRKEKKELITKQANQKSRVKPSSKQKQSKINRDEKSISTNIQKLRSQSQKGLIVLKSLFNQKFDEQLRQLVNEKSEGRRSQQFSLNSTRNIVNKAPLHKNKHKNTISAYKQIQQFINENIKTIKTQKTLLSRDLKINEDEPFLNAYFSREMKGNNSNINGKSQISIEVKLSDKKNNLSSARGGKIDKLSLKKASPSIKKFSIEKSSDVYNQASGRNEFISLQKLDRMRKNNSNSSPSDPVKRQKTSQRVNSMKKLNVNSKSKQKMSPSQSSVVSLPSVKKMVGSGAKLNEAETELINKKLYNFQLNNKQQQNNLLDLKKYNKIIKSQGNQPLKTQGQQNYLMKNYREEVYELFKNVVKRGREEEQIVTYENEKRKGYLKSQKSPEATHGKK